MEASIKNVNDRIERMKRMVPVLELGSVPDFLLYLLYTVEYQQREIRALQKLPPDIDIDHSAETKTTAP